MSKKVFVFLATGFEEIEAVTTIDLLRRAGLDTITIAIGDSLEVAGAHQLRLVADKLLTDITPSDASALVLPGGLPGVTNLAASESLKSHLVEAYKAGKLLAAICAAPSIFGELGFLEGREATCYPSFEPTLRGYKPTDKAVVVDGTVITGRSAGATVDFALSIITALLGKAEAEAVSKAIIYQA